MIDHHYALVGLSDGTTGSLRVAGEMPDPNRPATWTEAEKHVGQKATVWVDPDRQVEARVDWILDVLETDPRYPA